MIWFLELGKSCVSAFLLELTSLGRLTMAVGFMPKMEHFRGI